MKSTFMRRHSMERSRIGCKKAGETFALHKLDSSLRRNDVFYSTKLFI